MVVLPIAFVLCSAILSGLYKLAMGRQLTRTSQRRIIITHAIAIESIQILILLPGLLVQYFQIAAIFRNDTFTCYGFTVPFWVATPCTLGLYIMALLAVDMTDNKIQLGSWQHPIQPQTLLLTRKRLLPWILKHGVRRQLPANRTPCARPKSGPRATGTSGQATSSESQVARTLQRKYRSLSEPPTPTISFATAMICQRRGSIPEPGSVAKLVSNFERDPLEPKSAAKPKACDATESEDPPVPEDQVDESVTSSEASMGLPTPDSTPEKSSVRAKEHEEPISEERPEPSTELPTPTSIAEASPDTSVKDSILEEKDETLPDSPTPISTSEESSTLSDTPIQNDGLPFPYVGDAKPKKPEKSKEKAGRHTAERAQRWHSKTTNITPPPTRNKTR